MTPSVTPSQETLSGFAEATGTAFVSLLVSGRVVAATEGWWRLGMPEAVLLPWLVGSLPPQAARDYPVYLPHGSPTVSGRGKGRDLWWAGPGAYLAPCTLLQVPHRLLTLTLLRGLELCLLCGPRPPLSQLDPQVRLLSPPPAVVPSHLLRFLATQAPLPSPGPDLTRTTLPSAVVGTLVAAAAGAPPGLSASGP